MKNVLHIFWRDVKRIAKVPPAWLVVIFICILPSFYAWFNIVGFWDPYENTGNLRVCVVNEDIGVTDDVIGELDLGQQVTETLRQNTQFNWEFTSRNEALHQLDTGDAYAVFIIPETFSHDVASVFSGDFSQPTLNYYVNEKMNPVSPKITDKGADVLDISINDEFVSIVSATIASAVDKAAQDTEGSIEGLQASAAARVGKSAESLAGVRATIAELKTSSENSLVQIDATKADLAKAQETLTQLSKDLAGTSKIAETTSQSMVNFIASMGPVFNQVLLLTSQSSSEAHTAVSKTTNAIVAATGDVDAGLERAKAIAQETDEIIAALKAIADTLPDGAEKEALQETIKALQDKNAHAHELIGSLSGLSDNVASTAQSVDKAAGDVDTAVQGTVTSMNAFNNQFASQSVPALSQGVYSLGASVGSLSLAASNQALVISQVLVMLDQLKETITLSGDALTQTDSVLANFGESLTTLKTDLEAMSVSSALDAVAHGMQINPQSVAEFMLSPTKVESQELYPLNVYGSAMAPLFINLTLWIGVFMLMVIFRLEVDNAGVRNATIAQRYFGRSIFLAILAIVQAVICCIGCMIIGVQVIHVPLFFVTAIACSLAYLSIQYALSTTLQHVGKALCIILVFVQIPGATGLYPIEMTPEFFQNMYPLFPFTYGINAIRETTCGFYGTDWLECMGVLLGFFIAFTALGVLVRPYVTNLNRMFARQIEESDIINGETVELPEQHFRKSELIKLLSNRDAYRDVMRERVAVYVEKYPAIKRSVIMLSVVLPVIGTILLAVFGVEKVMILVFWLAWFVVASAAIILLEYVKDRLMRQNTYSDMTDDELKELYSEQYIIDGNVEHEGGAR